MHLSLQKNSSNRLQIGVDLVPLADGSNDAQVNQLITHVAQMLVAGVEFGILANLSAKVLIIVSICQIMNVFFI